MSETLILPSVTNLSSQPTVAPEQPEKPKIELQEKVDNAFEHLADQLSQGHTEEFKQTLAFFAEFHRYSFINSILIFLQKPDARHVASYRTWKKLGRQVAKGSKGAKVFVPISMKVNDPENPGQRIEKLVTFREGNVFSDRDLVDIETNPLPSFWRPLPDTAQDTYTFVLQKVQASGFTVEEIDHFGSAQGSCNPETKHISIASSLDSQNKTLTLLHELAHGLFHSKDAKVSYKIGEHEAESCAYLVGSILGIDYPYARDYLLNWKCDAEELKASAGRIQKLVREMIDELGLKSPMVEEV